MAKFDYDKSVEELANELLESVKPIIGFIVDVTKEFFDYPDKNVIRLALFSKKYRIRKKNRKKILNWISEERQKTVQTHEEATND